MHKYKIYLSVATLLLIILVGMKTSFAASKRLVIGFQPYWLLEKAENNYDDKINQLSYFGIGINREGKIVKMETDVAEEPGWTTYKSTRLAELFDKYKSENIQLSLLIHNAYENSIEILMEKPEENARTLLTELEPLMESGRFSDINVDIESFVIVSSDRQVRYARFLKTFADGVHAKKWGTVTVDIAPDALIKNQQINLASIKDIADYVVLMGYDFHYSGSYVAGPVAPVNGAGKIYEYDVTTAIKRALEVLPPEKLILGIPTYGYEWETLSATPGSAVIPGTGVTASTRRVITSVLKDCEKCITGVDKESQQPYVIFPDPDNDYYHQIYYEDKDSLAKKLDLARQYNLGGVALWALGYEDADMLEPLREYMQER